MNRHVLKHTAIPCCMANAVITFKIMPDNVEADLEAIEKEAIEKIVAYTGNDETKSEVQEVAFGLKAISIMFVMDEDKGSPEPLEKQVNGIEGVMSCETTDVRRAIG